MTISTSSRFQVVDVATKSPGVSFIGGSSNGPFLDTNLTIGQDERPPWRGRVYFTVDEVHEMAEQAGLYDSYNRELELASAMAAEAFDKGYDQGYNKGKNEAVDAAAVGLVDRMRAAVDRGRGDDHPAAEGVQHSAVEPVTVAEPVVRVDDENPFASDDAARDEGSARVSDGRGDAHIADTIR